MTTYTTTRPTPHAALLVRIRRTAAGDWLTVPLLATAPGWVQVDDGLGALWVMWEAVHPGDRATVGMLEQLGAGRN